MDHYRSALVGLGLPDDAIQISLAPSVKTPRGDSVPVRSQRVVNPAAPISCCAMCDACLWSTARPASAAVG
jgi:hypothetical protein